MVERDTSGFVRASHQSQALCLGMIAVAGLLTPIALWGFGPVHYVAGAAAAAGGVKLLRRARRHWHAHQTMLATGVDPTKVGEFFGAAPMLVQDYSDETLHRLVRVAQSRFPEKLVLDAEQIEFDVDDKGKRRLVSWGFRCLDPGFLADAAMQQKLWTTFTRSLGGIWKPHFDETGDSFGGTRRSTIPKLVFPPMWPVISTADEAKRRYTGWKFKLGESADGEVGVIMEKMAHVKVIGETGAGKSVAIRSWLEQFRAMGWMLILCDGKGADYAGYFAPHPEDHGLPVPGTVAVGLGSSRRGMAYVAAVVLAYQIVQERQEGSMQSKIDDPENWNNFVPVLLVLDEIKSMREKWRNNLSRDDAKAVESMITEITSLGRELRVHVLMVSQDARDVSIPGVWNSNLPLTVSLGKPGNLTVDKGFEDSVRPKVQMIRESMDPNLKGRCLIASVDPKTGAADATEYQGYIGYSPGESWNNPELPQLCATKWPPFKEQVSDRVPRLYTRQWFCLDAKSQAQLDAEAKGAPDRRFIDLEMFTVDELKELERVALDVRDSSGCIVPDPGVAMYDPASPRYVCRPPAKAGNHIKAEL